MTLAVILLAVVLLLVPNLTWKRTSHHAFMADEGRKKSSPEGFEDSVLHDLPFCGQPNIDLYFSFPF